MVAHPTARSGRNRPSKWEVHFLAAEARIIVAKRRVISGLSESTDIHLSGWVETHGMKCGSALPRTVAASLVLWCGFAAVTPAADSSPRTYANPVDVDYRYNFEQLNEQISYRTGADPVIVRHQDAYYLFMTLADGYWRSPNLLDWTFIVPS